MNKGEPNCNLTQSNSCFFLFNNQIVENTGSQVSDIMYNQLQNLSWQWYILRFYFELYK